MQQPLSLSDQPQAGACALSVQVQDAQSGAPQDIDILDELINTPIVGLPVPGTIAAFKRKQQRVIYIRLNDRFLTADPSGNIINERVKAGAWEAFFLISSVEIARLIELFAHDWVFDDGTRVDRGQTGTAAGFTVSCASRLIQITDVLDYAVGMSRNTTRPVNRSVDRESSAQMKFLTLYRRDNAQIAIRFENPYRLQIKRLETEIQLGYLERALASIKALRSTYGETEEISYYQRQAHDRLHPRPRSGGVILPLIDPVWEREWLNALLPDLQRTTLADATSAMKHQNVVVIDSLISSQRVEIYKKLYQSGCDITLFHLSDEAFIDDCSVYRWCKTVYRNYYSPIILDAAKVRFFALGYKDGFPHAVPIPLQRRTYRWSFAGDPRKTMRAAMLTAMRTVEGGFEHLTSGFDAADALSVTAYGELMRQSVFIPCPAGNMNLDSFRVYEALEAGSIPIVERRPGFDYFAEAFGSHPFPSLLDWGEAPDLIGRIVERGQAEALAAACFEWWGTYKASLKKQIAEGLDQA